MRSASTAHWAANRWRGHQRSSATRYSTRSRSAGKPDAPLQTRTARAPPFRLILIALEIPRLFVRQLARQVVRAGIGACVDIADVTDAARSEPRHHQHTPSRSALVVGQLHVPAQDGRERLQLAIGAALHTPFDGAAID